MLKEASLPVKMPGVKIHTEIERGYFIFHPINLDDKITLQAVGLPCI